MIRGEKWWLVVKFVVNKICFVSYFKKLYFVEYFLKFFLFIDICIGRDIKNVRDINILKGVIV